MTGICGVQSEAGMCTLFECHHGCHRTRGGVIFTDGDVAEFNSKVAEAEPDQKLNRAARRAAERKARKGKA